MKKHDILFQAQEEAFIQALEEEMARETPDPNAIRAILDQLDRQTGGAAFDPDAGWRELQTRRPAKRRRLGRYPVVLAAVLVCLAVAGTALAVNLGLHEKLAAYFHLQSGESALLESAIENPVTTVSDQGISVTIRQTLANSSGLYVLYEVTTPESIALDPEKNWHMEGFLDLSSLPLQAPLGSSIFGNDIVEVTPHKITAVAYAYTPVGTMSSGTVHLRLTRLGYWEFSSSPQFIPIAEGTWHLTWHLTHIDPSITVTPPALPLPDGSGNIESISLSPFSCVVISTGAPASDWPVSLVLQNGSTLPLDASNGQYTTGRLSASGQENPQYYSYFQFHPLISPSDITALVIGLNYSHYITSLRLEQAARLSTDTDDTALSIGYQVGYSAPNYFSRAFKKFYGISPSRYREQNRVPTV